MNDAFSLHPQLAADCADLGRLDLSRLLLMNDANYPWFILVPERPGLRELHELHGAERTLFWDESERLSRALLALYQPDKLNVACLGNRVPQLHVHHVARSASDPAWPGPVWGAAPARPYPSELLAARVAQMRQALGLKSA